MGANFTGVIIEESLTDTKVLKKLKIVKTEVEKTTPEHKSSAKQWTLHTVEIPENQVSKVAKELSKALEKEHGWYADFKNDTHHYIVFSGRVFYIDRTSRAQYDRARAYGISIGIPEDQVDFEKEVKA
jgi:hypothetical protein